MRVASVDTDVDELIHEGVHVCIARNNSFKVDARGGDDYDNNFNRGFRAVYYSRGTLHSTEAFMVGSLLSENATGDPKVYRSQVQE